MGWLWSSPNVPASAESNHASTANPPPASQPSSMIVPPRQLSREEAADQELQAFLRDLEATPQSSTTKYTRLPRPSAPPLTSTNDTDTIAEQLLPKTMSCRDAFDSAFYCNSMGGQFNNLYRYGTVRACSENWNDFWFCMKTRSYGTVEKEKAIRQRYREKERRKYGRHENIQGEEKFMIGTSSEDVWRSREERVEWGQAFNTPFPEFADDDEESNRLERVRRAAISKGRLDS